MQLGAKQQQSKAIYPLSPLPQVVFFSSCLPSTRKRIAQGIASRPPGADPAKDMRVHMYTRHFFKKMELVGKIHGQIRKQSVYVRLLELDSAQQEGKGMGAHTCRMLVGGEAPEEELAKGSSPLGKEGRESA